MLSHPFSFSARSLLLIHKVRCPFLFTSVITTQWPQTALTKDLRSLSKGFYRPELYKSKPDYMGIFNVTLQNLSLIAERLEYLQACQH